MIELPTQIRWLYRSASMFMAVCLMVWAIFPDIRAYAAGLFLGTFVSLINSIHLARKVVQIADMAEGKMKRAGIGLISRFCFVLIAVMIANRLSQIDVMFTAIGFFFAPLVSIVIGLALSLSKQE
ncbi:ATP synthase subunit I [Marinicrinis lubricantis]|uniref:ATP synthase subunit I n=1 Tax=Marinicrinis lubricantis TaxID=2086470 RepID=A0ABW1IKB3_9BACL